MPQNRGTALIGMGVGAGLMYFLDPSRGRRRRALLRDKLAHAVNVSVDAAGRTRRDLAQRTAGTAAWVRRARRRRPVDDAVVLERVRAQLGRVISHPRAIEVDVTSGRVTLRGPILHAEVNRLLRAVRRVGGVRDVHNALDVHADPGHVPALQGGSAPRAWRPDVLQRHWAPATRVIGGGTGAAVTAYGLSRHDVPGRILAALGAGLVARAATNLQIRRSLARSA